MRKSLTVVMVMALALFLTTPAMAQPQSGALMEKDVFTPLTLGYGFMQEGKYEAAEYEFKKALNADEFNSFALNNIAVLEERKGNYKSAMAYLDDAGRYADRYLDKVHQTCFIGGLCAAVKPVRQIGTESEIAKVVAENLAKLKAKMKAIPKKPEPSKPPKM